MHGWPQLVRLDGLQQVSQNMLIHGTLDQSLIAIRRDCDGGHHARFIDLTQGCQPVQVRQVNIEDNHVRLFRQHNAHHIGPGSSLAQHLVS